MPVTWSATPIPTMSTTEQARTMPDGRAANALRSRSMGLKVGIGSRRPLLDPNGQARCLGGGGDGLEGLVHAGEALQGVLDVVAEPESHALLQPEVVAGHQKD